VSSIFERGDLESVSIVERKELPQGLTLINGLPDVGLVGVLAVSHLVSSLKMEEAGSIESELFPPLVVLHRGLPRSPMRIFVKDSIAAIVSETAVPSEAVHDLADAIVKWAHLKNAKMVISVGGMAVQNRQNIEKPKVFAALTNEGLAKMLGDSAEVLQEGYMVGPYALILKKCFDFKISGITLLAQSFYNYPDPEAAAAVLGSLEKITGVAVDVSELLQKGEEIRLRAKDIMRRTQEEMSKMSKSHEYEVPPLYG
jgi:uncharacterized protein